MCPDRSQTSIRTCALSAFRIRPARRSRLDCRGPAAAPSVPLPRPSDCARAVLLIAGGLQRRDAGVLLHPQRIHPWPLSRLPGGMPSPGSCFSGGCGCARGPCADARVFVPAQGGLWCYNQNTCDLVRVAAFQEQVPADDTLRLARADSLCGGSFSALQRFQHQPWLMSSNKTTNQIALGGPSVPPACQA